MKKLFTILAVVFLLTACADARVKVSGSSTTLITVGSDKITKGQIFSTFLSRYPSETVLKMATRNILDKEVPATDAAIKAAADTALAAMKKTWGTEFPTFLTTYGFASEKDYYDNELTVTAQTNALTNKYITTNFDSLAVTYLPRKIRVIQTSSSDNAVKAIAEIKNGANFGATATKYSSSSYKGNEQIVTTKSTLFAAALTYATSAAVPSLTPTAIADTTNNVWYVIQVTVADPSKFKDEVITALEADTAFQEVAMVSYFKAGNFKVYDKTVYDEFKTSYAAYLIQK